MENLGDGIKKILLAGVGTIAVTSEKSKEILDELVKKGELTVEQGKALNQELKHNLKETVKDKVNVSVKPSSPEELGELLEKMTINPAKLYHLPQGRLQEGCPADLVIFDPEEEWIVKDYKSKASNSPFTGWKLKGKVKYTICDGKVVE